jgi:hypothetical protein
VTGGICWDGSREALRELLEQLPDCVAGHHAADGRLYVRTAGNPETPVPYGWYVTRTGDGLAAISPPERAELA